MAADKPSRQAGRRLSRPRSERPATREQLAAAKSELALFTSGAAHDLQQPLRQIIAMATRLCGECPTCDPASREGGRIIELAQGMRGLVEYLVAYQQAGTTTLDIRPQATAALVGEALFDLRRQIDALQARVTVRDLPPVRADAIQLKQALHHLLENALKFHRPGRPPVVKVRGARREGGVELCVEDQGIGIERRYLEAVFEPFRRLNPPDVFPGSGLGLAICRRIARRHGGRVDARSEPGRGSRFTLWLPDAPD